MIQLNIKPLSVNQAYQGRRFRTKKYDVYERNVRHLLPKMEGKITAGMKLHLILHYGFSSTASDIDNPTKPFQDIISKHYGFNDKQIYRLEVTKEVVKKGCDFIQFSLREMHEP